MFYLRVERLNDGWIDEHQAGKPWVGIPVQPGSTNEFDSMSPAEGKEIHYYVWFHNFVNMSAPDSFDVLLFTLHFSIRESKIQLTILTRICEVPFLGFCSPDRSNIWATHIYLSRYLEILLTSHSAATNNCYDIWKNSLQIFYWLIQPCLISMFAHQPLSGCHQW